MNAVKTVLVTGAAVRVGRALALSFAQGGWNVVIHYHRSEKEAQSLANEIGKLKQQAHLVRADLSDASAVAEIIPSLVQRKATPDLLINNAAVFEKDGIATLSPASWDLHMKTNLLAPLMLMRDFAAHYQGTEGNIINLTDGLYGWSMSPVFLSYSLSKEGLNDATRFLAKELAPRIRVNAIALGATLESKHDGKETFDKLRNIIPLGRTSSPDEVARTAHYIISTPTLTGQIVSLSGGMTKP